MLNIYSLLLNFDGVFIYNDKVYSNLKEISFKKHRVFHLLTVITTCDQRTLSLYKLN